MVLGKYAKYKGFCKGGVSPNNTGAALHKNANCKEICEKSANCSGYSIHVSDQIKDCYTFTSLDVYGDGRDYYVCYSKTGIFDIIRAGLFQFDKYMLISGNRIYR